MISECVTVREAAKHLGLRESTIRKWILLRRIGVVRLGRAVRLRMADLDKLLREGYRPAVKEGKTNLTKGEY